jgi:hypothetical protein
MTKANENVTDNKMSETEKKKESALDHKRKMDRERLAKKRALARSTVAGDKAQKAKQNAEQARTRAKDAPQREAEKAQRLKEKKSMTIKAYNVEKKFVDTIKDEVSKAKTLINEGGDPASINFQPVSEATHKYIYGIEDMKNAEDLIKAVYSAHQRYDPPLKKRPSITTLRDYVNNKIRLVFARMFPDKIGEYNPLDLNWLKEYKKVIAIPEVKMDIVSSIISVTKYIHGFQGEVLNAYGAELTRLKKIQDDKGESGVSSAKDAENLMPWLNILELRPNIKAKGTLRQLVIFDLYTKLPPRRKQAYALLVLTKDKTTVQLKNMDPNYNYANMITKTNSNKKLAPQNYRIKTILLNKYKTSEKYGQYIMEDLDGDFPVDLSDLMVKYINEFHIDSGNPVFGTKDKEFYHKTSWRDLDTLLKKFSGKAMTATSLRKSFVSFQMKLISTQKGMVVDADRKKLAKYLGHSFQVLGNYMKTDIGEP